MQATAEYTMLIHECLMIRMKYKEHPVDYFARGSTQRDRLALALLGLSPSGVNAKHILSVVVRIIVEPK